MYPFVKGYPLEKVEIACFQTGVYVLDDSRTQVAGMPWLTVISDVYSRYILGFHLTMEEPSLKTMAIAIENAIEEKSWIDKYDSIEHKWLSYGIPETIICPKKYNVQPICDVLEINVDQNITRKMNRWFKTVQDDLFCRLPGNNILAKQDKRLKPEKHAKLTLESLEEVFLLWLLGVHHNSYHSGVYGSPIEVYTYGIQKNPPQMPNNPRWKEELHELFTQSKGKKEKTVQVTTDDIRLCLGESIQKLRKKMKLSTESLARKTILEESEICEIEEGNREVAAEEIFSIALALKLMPSELMKEVEKKLIEM